MTVVHRLTGYDNKTERLAIEHHVPASKLNHAKELAGVRHDDVDAAGSYPLSADQARAMARLVNQVVDMDRYSWFLEPFDESDVEDTAA